MMFAFDATLYLGCLDSSHWLCSAPPFRLSGERPLLPWRVLHKYRDTLGLADRHMEGHDWELDTPAQRWAGVVAPQGQHEQALCLCRFDLHLHLLTVAFNSLASSAWTPTKNATFGLLWTWASSS